MCIVMCSTVRWSACRPVPDQLARINLPSYQSKRGFVSQIRIAVQVADKVQKQDTAFVAAYPHFNVNGAVTVHLNCSETF